ncbi:nucleotidyl transferase AbiEii/AbiGii toxin family protein [Psychromonas sp. SR45-3]|uniref:nucleotidyl transferase AbiEii/AbiGii toxin family protein n=1 Tax=Psychromonas sp. SR45-3 TaxID=2760930 RepID=UPI0015F98CA9|nr:nucleotidyl transferase AbiEii/AbiGii toxin family protein [Psychromonas sp. SR45-3]MBB1272504.1 nucleotidyl transferase AbiEii/AbiGii toxin family protein [Psychromonas sp. SR45-3]
MANYAIKHHQIIESALENFNADFFCANKVIFGGGTRIALELSEFRESIDIDFLCPNKDAYRAVREQVTNRTLGDLVKKDFTYAREIRADRDAVRTIIKYENTAIKLEFVSFDNYELNSLIDLDKFPVPFLDQQSCFYTKLLANADRKLTLPHKDIFDILAMYKEWGSIPNKAIELAEGHYGKRVIIPSVIEALQDIIENPREYERVAISLKMKKEWIEDIINIYPKFLLSDLTK